MVSSKKKLEYALKLHKRGGISLGRAAEIAGISIWEMLDIAKERKIDWVGLTAEGIEREFERAMKLSKEIDEEAKLKNSNNSSQPVPN